MDERIENGLEAVVRGLGEYYLSARDTSHRSVIDRSTYGLITMLCRSDARQGARFQALYDKIKMGTIPVWATPENKSQYRLPFTKE